MGVEGSFFEHTPQNFKIDLTLLVVLIEGYSLKIEPAIPNSSFVNLSIF